MTPEIINGDYVKSGNRLKEAVFILIKILDHIFLQQKAGIVIILRHLHGRRFPIWMVFI